MNIKDFNSFNESSDINKRKVEIYIKSSGSKFFPSNNLVKSICDDIKKSDSDFKVTDKNGKLPNKVRVVYAETILTPKQIMNILGKRKEKQETFYFEVISKGRIN